MIATPHTIDREAFVRAYAETAVWLAFNEHGEPYWNVSGPADGLIDPDDHLPEGWREEEPFADCADFLDSRAEALIAEEIERAGYSAEQAGHDFYLTRNGHGAGFWDRGLDHGRELTDLAKPYGEHVEIIEGTAD